MMMPVIFLLIDYHRKSIESNNDDVDTALEASWFSIHHFKSIDLTGKNPATIKKRSKKWGRWSLIFDLDTTIVILIYFFFNISSFLISNFSIDSKNFNICSRFNNLTQNLYSSLERIWLSSIRFDQKYCLEYNDGFWWWS